jgi:hypothetical protein
VYGANQSTPNNQFNIEYSQDFGVTWFNLDTNISTIICSSFGFIDVAPNSDFRFRIVQSGTLDVVNFNYNFSSTCPTTTDIYCELQIPNVSSDYSIAALVTVNAGAYTLCNPPITTTTTTSTTTEAPTTTSTTTSTTTEEPTTTSTTTTSTTAAPTTTSTTTSTTTLVSQATLQFSFTNSGGAVSLAINVISGTILDNIGYFGSVRGWTNPGCDSGQVSPDESYNNTLFAPASGTSTQIWTSASAVLSASLLSLLINGIPVNTPDEYITYNGSVYRILGFGICLSSAPTTTTTSTTTSTTTAAPTTTTTSTTSTSTTVQPIQAQIFMTFTTNSGLVTDIGTVVAEGTTLDNLDFSGNTNTYSLTNCAGTATANSFSFTLLAGSSFNSQPFGTTGPSGKVTLLNVSTNSITTSPQTILVGGNLYQIYFFNQCTSA